MPSAVARALVASQCTALAPITCYLRSRAQELLLGVAVQPNAVGHAESAPDRHLHIYLSLSNMFISVCDQILNRAIASEDDDLEAYQPNGDDNAGTQHGGAATAT